MREEQEWRAGLEKAEIEAEAARRRQEAAYREEEQRTAAKARLEWEVVEESKRAAASAIDQGATDESQQNESASSHDSNVNQQQKQNRRPKAGLPKVLPLPPRASKKKMKKGDIRPSRDKAVSPTLLEGLAACPLRALNPRRVPHITASPSRPTTTPPIATNASSLPAPVPSSPPSSHEEMPITSPSSETPVTSSSADPLPSPSRDNRRLSPLPPTVSMTPAPHPQSPSSTAKRGRTAPISSPTTGRHGNAISGRGGSRPASTSPKRQPVKSRFEAVGNVGCVQRGFSPVRGVGSPQQKQPDGDGKARGDRRMAATSPTLKPISRGSKAERAGRKQHQANIALWEEISVDVLPAPDSFAGMIIQHLRDQWFEARGSSQLPILPRVYAKRKI